MLHAAKNFVALEKFQKQPPEVSYKEGVPKNFAKFTGKHLNQSLFLVKFQTCTCFPVILLLSFFKSFPVLQNF